MSLFQGFPLVHDQLQFSGYSLAGITTSVFFKNASVCFDVGQGLPFQVPAKRLLITHAHSDHASGIHYLLSQKAMQRLHGTEIYVPSKMPETLEKILNLWKELEEFGYEYTIHPALPGNFYELDKLFSMKPFLTPHRIQSQGYIIYRNRKRLRENLRLGGDEAMRAARERGEDLSEYFREPVCAFTGDTKIEFIDSDPDIAKARLLFMEVTFWDEKRTIESTREWGHIHFEEFIKILPRLANEKIALIHASSRYSSGYLNGILDRRLTPADRARVVLFPRDI